MEVMEEYDKQYPLPEAQDAMYDMYFYEQQQ
jgi:hypothetical protein